MNTTEIGQESEISDQLKAELDLKIKENRDRVNAEYSRYQSRRREIERQLEALDEEHSNALNELFEEIRNS